ncbi:MAG: hypothetical protein JSS27_13450 [Planctomycetes bacterium]|nr:hypothetical protein [Planctomycetota bacterium]
MFSRTLLVRLLAGLLLLPIGLLLLVGVGAILHAMGDADGTRWMVRLAALLAVGWGVDLVALVAVTALRMWEASPSADIDDLEG